MADRVTGREIILGILENMQEGMEPLLYTTLAPGLFDVYLHTSDYERLQGILPHVTEEARKALDEAIGRLNGGERRRRWTLPFLDSIEKTPVKYLKPTMGWSISFHQNVDDAVAPGDLLIESTLALPEKPEMGAGLGTRKVLTLRSGGVSRVVQRVTKPSVNPPEIVANTTSPMPAAATEIVFARIAWRDLSGPHQFLMTKNQIVAGRGGTDHWVDLKLEASTEISREHFRLRRDEKTGAIFIRDLSSFGTSVNGQRLPSSMEERQGELRDVQREVALPRNATILLADRILLEFEALEVP